MQIVERATFYELIFDYNPYIIARVKEIPGRWWDAPKKRWCVPKHSSADLNVLLSQYGNKSQLRPEVIMDIPALPELDREIPLLLPMYPYQTQGVAYNIINKHVIVGDEPGLGKTIQSIATTIALNAFPALIICPASLKINWEREWQKVAGMKALILSDRIKTTWPTYYKVGMVKVFITNYQSLKKYFVQEIKKEIDPETGEPKPLKLSHIVFKDSINLFNTVIIDEGHRCKDGSTQQTKFVMGIAKGKELVLDLTGTPVVNKPKDLISQLRILGRLQDFGGYKQFMNRYCGGNGSGAFNLKELNYRLSTICFYRRQKKDVLKELPDKVRQIILCDITNRKEYDDAEDDLANYLKEYKEKTDPEIEKSMRGEIMVKIGVCKSIAARGKLQDAKEFIDEILDAGEKLVLFREHKEISKILKEYYPKAVTVSGEDGMEERQMNVDNFQKTSWTNLILCSIKAGGVGITLTASSRVGFVELPWHAADADQCEDRCHRIGQKDSVQCTYFLGRNTIDEVIYETIEKKRLMSDTITGSIDNVQKEIIDKLSNSLFNKKNEPDSINE